MPRPLKIITFGLLGTLLAFLFLAAGITAGYYYQPEISVLLKGMFPSDAAPAATPAPVSADASTNIYLPHLDEPLPLIFSETLDEDKIQEQLQRGAVVLPLGTSLGERGNVVITAHSTGTAAFGPYRFAFAGLAELKDGEEVIIKTSAADYTYQVYSREIVWPHEVDKLPQGEQSTITLVTCWPLWTNFKRLLVNAQLTKTEYR